MKKVVSAIIFIYLVFHLFNINIVYAEEPTEQIMYDSGLLTDTVNFTYVGNTNSTFQFDYDDAVVEVIGNTTAGTTNSGQSSPTVTLRYYNEQGQQQGDFYFQINFGWDYGSEFPNSNVWYVWNLNYNGTIGTFLQVDTGAYAVPGAKTGMDWRIAYCNETGSLIFLAEGWEGGTVQTEGVIMGFVIDVASYVEVPEHDIAYIVGTGTGSTAYDCDIWSSQTLYLHGEFPEPEPCFQYTIEFEHFTETLVMDDTWLHDIFYQEMLWDNAFRYSSTVRVLDAYGKTVEGYLAPVPLTIYGIESLGWAWPPRQFNTFEEYWNEEKLNTPRFHIKSSSFKNIYWVGEVEPNLAKQAMIWVFEPVDPKYKRGVFTWYIYEHRDALGIHQDYTLWPEPYYQIQYEFSYMHTVTCEHDEFGDTPITDMDPEWADEHGPSLPDMGWDDRVYPDRLFQKVTEMAEELVETFNNKAPFGYLVMFFNVLQDFPDDIDSQDVTLDIPFMEEVIEMDLTPDYMSGIFSTIRLFSGWVLYAFLGFFFYKEYRKITGSGGEG